MDINAKAHQRQDSLSPLPVQHTIDGEGWQIYHNVPSNASIEGTPHQHEISTNLEDTLVDVIEGGRLK
eukprot:12077188-Ditylum_brightwellii.AAC.1